MKEYRLTSTEWYYAPGVINWARSGMTPDDARKFFRKAYNRLPKVVIDKLVDGNYTVEDDVVVVLAITGHAIP